MVLWSPANTYVYMYTRIQSDVVVWTQHNRTIPESGTLSSGWINIDNQSDEKYEKKIAELHRIVSCN